MIRTVTWDLIPATLAIKKANCVFCVTIAEKLHSHRWQCRVVLEILDCQGKYVNVDVFIVFPVIKRANNSLWRGERKKPEHLLSLPSIATSIFGCLHWNLHRFLFLSKRQTERKAERALSAIIICRTNKNNQNVFCPRIFLKDTTHVVVVGGRSQSL